MAFSTGVPDGFDRATLILDGDEAYEADAHVQISGRAWRLIYEEDVPAYVGMYPDVVLGSHAATCEVFLVERDGDGDGTQIDIKL